MSELKYSLEETPTSILLSTRTLWSARSSIAETYLERRATRGIKVSLYLQILDVEWERSPDR